MEVDRVCYFYNSSFHPIDTIYINFVSRPKIDLEADLINL